MRLRSDLFVAALLRGAFAAGGFGAVERRGAPEAGAIFIRQRRRDGLENLYAPAPQSLAGQDEDPGHRCFELRLAGVPAEAADALLTRECRFDGDLWVVEIEAETVEGLFILM